MRRLLLPLCALATLGAAAPAAAFTESELRSKLAREMRLTGSASGALVRDLDSGATLYARRADAPRIPASVEKLFVTSAALLRFGAGERLATTVHRAGEVDADGVLAGDLHLVGGGDAFLGASRLRALAEAVAAAGITRVQGRVRGDESLFDAARSVRFRGYDSDLGGVLGAVTYNRGIDGGRVRLDAARHAASAFVGALRTAGVRVDAGSATGAAPQGAVEVARAQTGTMGAIAEAVNVPSNNFAAEMLLKGLGARFGAGGSTAKGAAVVRDTLDDLGVRPRIADGSGLSRANRTTPRQVVRLLQRIDGQAPIRRAFRSSLAVAGRTGTLRRRMRGTPAASRCRGKTGTLRGVSALVGVCRTRGGRDVAFAFLSNGVNPSSAKRVEDRMVAAVARLQR